ncbi:acid sphingomyelinase-like phosphodiesterase 3b [Grus japonensis]|uniref:Acid sphingomyelinase-like phosphodiesterase 3b n=1 Tax=Grus japonensis TaxID=30415 RepID=A0ABC9WDS4_GRUJA
MPAGSKMDPPLAKAKPISDGGSTSGVTELRRGKQVVQQLQPERGVRIRERNNYADRSVRERRCSRHQSRDSPAAACGEDHGEAGCPLQPMEDDGGADIHLQPMEDPTLEQVEAPKGGCDPMGSPHWSRLLAGPVDPWRECLMLWLS